MKTTNHTDRRKHSRSRRRDAILKLARARVSPSTAQLRASVAQLAKAAEPTLARAEGFAAQFRSRFPDLLRFQGHHRMPHEMSPSMAALLCSPQAKVRRVQALRSEYARAIDDAGLITVDEAKHRTREHFRPIVEHAIVRKHPKLRREIQQLIDTAVARLEAKAF